MGERTVQTPWGAVRVLSQQLPASEPDFDYAAPWLRELVAPHFGDDHTIWVTASAIGVERIECCGETLWQREEER